jgi:hypothetical protein
MMNLMYITKHPVIAQIAEEAGVDWIFVDMEFIGKDVRQSGLDTVQNHHTIDDVRSIKAAVKKAKVLVRVNPIHDTTSDYVSSEDEINGVIEAGADIIMLPFFKTVIEVERFVRAVNGRAKCCLLLETPESVAILEDIVAVPGIDMIHLGLNDMHLALGMKFMFELLANGSVDKWTNFIKEKSIPFGFGGIAALDSGAVPGRMILKEHYRLGSQQVIVSRSFCNTDQVTDINEVREIFQNGISEIRALESECKQQTAEYFEQNRKATKKVIEEFVKKQ